VRAHRSGPALRLRAEGLTLRALFIVCLLLIATGIAFSLVAGLTHH
jgi:hypothetical protein